MESIINAVRLWVQSIGVAFDSIGALLGWIPRVLEVLYGTFVYVPDFIVPFLAISMILTMIVGLLRLITG